MAVAAQTVDRRVVEKSAQAFRTISEVAAELDVPQHVLRFWESKFNQVRPLKRGGGRRYYRPEDIDLLRRIRTLLYEDGYTIKGVQRLLKEGRGRLPQQRLDIAAESALESLRIVSARAEAMAGGQRPMPRSGPQPATNTPRAAMLDLHKRREIETVLEDLEQALTQLRTTLKQQN
ncbi:MAG: MerR family transcriptional regulator [Alphaproteobacteria bacterium]|nr:MAG: MerR family transcriptional regulator [Alphaproteobacteria bacterium]